MIATWRNVPELRLPSTPGGEGDHISSAVTRLGAAEIIWSR
jgi:hypothetical protein